MNKGGGLGLAPIRAEEEEKGEVFALSCSRLGLGDGQIQGALETS